MSVCGRFWRSTTLIAGILVVNLITTFGGLTGVPFLRSIYWTADRRGGWQSVWSIDPHIQSGLFAIWTIRLLLLVKIVCSLNQVHQIIVIHSFRYTANAFRMSKAVFLLLISTFAHLTCSLIQSALFWSVIVGQAPKGFSYLEWLRSVVERGRVGVAPILFTLCLVAEVAAVGLALWYRLQSGKWQKFNTDLASIFPASLPIA